MREEDIPNIRYGPGRAKAVNALNRAGYRAWANVIGLFFALGVGLPVLINMVVQPPASRDYILSMFLILKRGYTSSGLSTSSQTLCRRKSW